MTGNSYSDMYRYRQVTHVVMAFVATFNTAMLAVFVDSQVSTFFLLFAALGFAFVFFNELRIWWKGSLDDIVTDILIATGKQHLTKMQKE